MANPRLHATLTSTGHQETVAFASEGGAISG